LQKIYNNRNSKYQVHHFISKKYKVLPGSSPTAHRAVPPGRATVQFTAQGNLNSSDFTKTVASSNLTAMSLLLHARISAPVGFLYISIAFVMPFSDVVTRVLHSQKNNNTQRVVKMYESNTVKSSSNASMIHLSGDNNSVRLSRE